jgi:Domain of unknown function (DUF4160)
MTERETFSCNPSKLTRCYPRADYSFTMPVIFRYDGFRVFFCANETTPREPMRVHMTWAGKEAKFWLYPEIRVARNFGFDDVTLRRLAHVIKERQALIEKAWFDYFA